MRALLSLQLRRLCSGSLTPFLLAVSTLLLGWRFLAAVDETLVMQEQLAELPVAVTRAVVQPLLASAALLLAGLAAMLAAQGANSERRRGADLLVAASPVGDAAEVLARWAGVALVLWLTVVLAALVAAGAGLGADIDEGAALSAVLGLLAWSLLAAGIAVLAASSTRAVLGAIGVSLLLLIALWAPEAASVARGVNDSGLAAVSISRRLSPLLNGELVLASLVFFVAGAGIVLCLAWLQISRRSILQRASISSLALALCVAAVALADQQDLRWDLTRGKLHTLSPASRHLLAGLDGPVEVLALRDARVPLSAIETFLQRYRRHHPQLNLTLVDPATEADRVSELGLSGSDLLVRYQGRETRLGNLSETDLTAALQRLSSTEQLRVAYVVGGGERDLRGAADTDWGRFGQVLNDRAITVLPVDLVINPAVPDNLDLLVYAPLGGPPIPGVTEAVADHLERGGNLWWLTEPGLDAAFAPMASALGVDQLPGTLVDARAADHGLTDPRQIYVARHVQRAPTQELRKPVLMVGAAGWRATDGPFASHAALLSGPATWNEVGPIAGAIRPDDGSEQTGPLPIALALQRAHDGVGQRVVVMGDGDFLSNRYLGSGGNLELGLRLVEWLLDRGGAAIAVHQPPDRRLALSNSQVGMLGLLWLVAVPGGLLLLAGTRWWRRRRA